MRSVVTGSVVVAAMLVFSLCLVWRKAVRTGRARRRPTTLGARSLARYGLNAKDTGGPAPKQSIAGAWAGPQEAKIANRLR